MHLLQENTWATGNQAIVMVTVTVILTETGIIVIVIVIAITATVTTAGEIGTATVIRMEEITGRTGVIAEALHPVVTQLSIVVVEVTLVVLQEVVAHLATETMMLRYRMVLAKVIDGRRYCLLCFIQRLVLQAFLGAKTYNIQNQSLFTMT